MENQNKYEAPEVTITVLDSEDVLVVSGGEVENIPWAW